MKKILSLSVIAIFLLSACNTVEEEVVELTIDSTEEQNVSTVRRPRLPVPDHTSPEVFITETERDTTVEGFPNWELTRGILPYPDPEPLIFEGEEVIEGWVEYVPFYIEDEVAHFHVAEQSQSLIPYKSKTYDFILIEEDPDNQWGRKFEDKDYEPLLKYSEENPAKIRINKLLYSMEGSGKMQIVEIVE